MKESVRIFLLKLLAVTALSMFIYPAVLIIRTAVFHENGGIPALLFYLLLILSGLLTGKVLIRDSSAFYGRIADLRAVKLVLFLLNITEKVRFISMAAAYSILVLPVLAAVILFKGSGALRLVFEIIFAFLPYFISLRGSPRGYMEISGNLVPYFGFFVLAVSIGTANFYTAALFLKPYIYAITYFYILAFLILKNQEDIDSNIYARKYVEKSILPRNMRSFNTAAVLILFAAILMLFYLKPVVVFLLDVIRRIIGLAVWSILWIIRKLLPTSPDNAQNVDPYMPPGFAGESMAGINPLKNLIGNTLKTFAVLYILYRAIPFILKKLRSLFSKLVEFLGRLLNWHKAGSITGVEDYDDETVTEKPQKESDRRRSFKARIRSARRDLKGITDPVERVRYIYSSILGMLRIFGVEVEKSDTTTEIYAKSGYIQGISLPFRLLTGTYNRTRYGNSVPDAAALAEAEDNYSKAVELLKRK